MVAVLLESEFGYVSDAYIGEHWVIDFWMTKVAPTHKLPALQHGGLQSVRLSEVGRLKTLPFLPTSRCPNRRKPRTCYGRVGPLDGLRSCLFA